MNKINKFYNEGKLVFNVEYEAKVGSCIICVEKGLWYKFQIDDVIELEDHTFDVLTTKLLSVDDQLYID